MMQQPLFCVHLQVVIQPVSGFIVVYSSLFWLCAKGLVGFAHGYTCIPVHRAIEVC